MKYRYLLIFLIISISCKFQVGGEDPILDSNSELKPPFKNQGEQEDYWAQELFKKQYEKSYFSKFTGDIRIVEGRIQFGEIQLLELLNSNSKYNQIFLNGLIYPDILNASYLRISNIEELEFLSKSPKIKRFRFLVFRPKMSNPQVYFFELTNERANDYTDWDSFIINAKLTFVKEGWIII